MPSIREVAHKAGVAVGTVSRVLNDSPHVTDATRRRVKKAIAELGFQPNPSAQALRSNRTNLVALTIPELTNPYFAAIADGVQHAIAKANLKLIIGNSGLKEEDERQYLSMLSNRQVDGMIVVSRMFEPPQRNQRELLKRGREGYPIVSLGRHIEQRDMPFDAITTDATIGTRQAMMYLLDGNHTKIAYFGAPPGIATRRLEAYKNALRERKIPVDTSLILNTEATFEGGVKLATAILSRKERPSAIICVNDMVAIGAIITFQEYGIRIPDEVSVVGCDDIPLASLIRPSLTTIVQPKYEVGCLAAERLLGRMERKITEFKNISLPTQLQIRNSTSSLRPNLRRR